MKAGLTILTQMKIHVIELLLVILGVLNFVGSIDAQDNAQLAMRARINLYETWKFDSVAYYFNQIIDQKHTPAFAYSDYGWYLMLSDQHDLGMQYIRRAANMEAPDQKQLTAWYAWALVWVGDLKQAKHWIDQSIKLDPDYAEGFFVASLVASDEGNHEEALRLAEHAASLDPNWRSGVPLAYAKSGNNQKALESIDIISSDVKSFDTLILMEVFAYMKNTNKAIEYLNKAFLLRHPFMPWVQFIPATEYLHDHPQFKNIIQKLNLPE